MDKGHKNLLKSFIHAEDTMKGFFNQILIIDLTWKKYYKEEIPAERGSIPHIRLNHMHATDVSWPAGG
jgi:hypothetical protein